MNILMVSDVFPPKCGGAGWSSFYLAKALQKKGHQLTIVTLDNQNLGGGYQRYEGLATYRVAGIRGKGIHPLEQELTPYYLRKQIKKLLKKQSFDVIHAQYLRSAIASMDLGIPLVTSVRDLWPMCFKGTLYRSYSKKRCTNTSWFNCWRCIFFENKFLVKLLSPIILPYMKWRTNKGKKALQASNKIVTVSDRIRSKVVEVTLPEKITYIYNIVSDYSAEEFKKIPAKKWNKPSILYVGKLSVPKGVEMIQQAALHIKEDVKYVFAGNGELLEQTKEFFKKHKKDAEFVQLTNKEVIQYMKGCTVFVHTSDCEDALSRTILEALASGAPTIITKRGGGPEMVTHEKNGFIVNPQNTREGGKLFAHYISKLLADPQLRQTLSEEAKQPNHKFDEDHIVNRYVHLYQEARK